MGINYMNRNNIIFLLSQYYDRYSHRYDYKFNRSAFSEAFEIVVFYTKQAVAEHIFMQ